ncbi:MAG: hypothetical protein HOQ46_08240, partial [Saccharothrix sp.]|nr:hypothetical protein [Saccharothrix sp.]
MTSKPTLNLPSARYEAYRHTELAQVVEQNFKPEIAHRIADDWKTIGEALTELAVDFSVIITGSKDGWTGSAAEGARNALLKVGEFSDTTGDHFIRTSEAVREQADAAGEAKTKMPPPVDFDPQKMFSDAVRSGNLLDVMALPFAIPAQKAKADAARAEAVDVLYARDDALYSATLGMPALAEPPKVTQEQGVTTTASHTSSAVTRTVDPVGRAGTETTTTASPMGTTGVADTSGTTRTSWTPPTVTTPPPQTPPQAPPAHHQPPTTPPVPPPGVMPPGRRPVGSTPPGT